jgi:hypothetical protein
MSERKCRKCGESIPLKIKIDGKVKSLQNRKFCLKCSPFKSGNRNQYDPDKRRAGDRYSDYTPERKEQIILSLYKRGLERKSKLIDMSGGCCSLCGYNKTRRALTFHHTDPQTKDFGLSLDNLWSKKWEIILEEYNKCILVCMNCHMEVEQDISDKTLSYINKINQKYGTNF